jgi:hypothetical protein
MLQANCSFFNHNFLLFIISTLHIIYSVYYKKRELNRMKVTTSPRLCTTLVFHQQKQTNEQKNANNRLF